MQEIAFLTVTETRRRILTGRLSPRLVLEAVLERIRLREPLIHAYAHHDPGPLWQLLPPEGPLTGATFGVKDVLDTADMPTAYGSPIYAGHRPRADAACVALARRAGGIVLGKTVTTEFATRHPGPTVNPHNPAHTPGGSSSGSAAAVADGMAHVGFGTQTAGSIIRPAAYCGVVGFKPSFGTLHRGGMKVMSETLDTIGVITRSVADAALVMAALTGGDFGAPETALDRPPRLALVLGPGAAIASTDTLALLEAAADACRRAGATVTPMELPPVVAAAHEAHPVVMHGESAQALAWERAERAPLLSPILRERLDWGAAHGFAALQAARHALREAQAAFPAALGEHEAVLTPSAPGVAPEGLSHTGDPACNAIWTALGLPCVTVPVASGEKDLPLGVQIVGRFGEDARTLAIAEWVRQAITSG
ncbi:MAG: amidase [Rhodovarius sp.]|nr:amidase [Rhodovarius sp.]